MHELTRVTDGHTKSLICRTYHELAMYERVAIVQRQRARSCRPDMGTKRNQNDFDEHVSITRTRPVET